MRQSETIELRNGLIAQLTAITQHTIRQRRTKAEHDRAVDSILVEADTLPRWASAFVEGYADALGETIRCHLQLAAHTGVEWTPVDYFDSLPSGKPLALVWRSNPSSVWEEL